MLSIIIDQREPEWVKQLQFSNTQTVVSLLDCGDLWVATEDSQLLIVERKEPSDLLNSIKDGRLLEQCHKMKAQSQWCYVVITSPLFPGPNGKVFVGQRETGWNYDAVEGALLTVQELGCFVVHCKNDMDFGPTVERLIKRERGLLSIGCVRSSNILSSGEQLLTTLPGIGLDKAQRLLQYEHAAANALQFLTELGKKNKVPGISDGIKQNVKKALGLAPDESLIVINSLDREFIGLDKEKTGNE